MKVAVVGCTHAGTAAIKNIAALYPEVEITVYEKNDNVSFLSCGIALYVGGVAKDPNGLFYSSPNELAKLGANMKMKHEVLTIDTDKNILIAKNLDTEEIFEDSFDKLVMTTGSWPVIPNIPGINQDNIVLCKNFHHANQIIEKAKRAEKIAVIGAGYIGVELVEAFEVYGKEVTFIDGEDRILSKYLDAEYTDMIEAELINHGVNMALNQTVTHFEGKSGKVAKVVTTKGEYEADLVILCVGFRPNTDLLKGQVDMLPNGAIKVNEYMQASKEQVFAAGDSCAIMYNPTKQHAYIPLATNAVRMGALVAKNLLKPTIKYMGTQGTSGLHIYDYNMASTGLTESAAKLVNMNVKSITIKENNRPEFMPTYEEVMLKVVYEVGTNRIIGAQVISKADMTQSINTISVCIQNEMTIEELAYVDFFFQPHFNKPVNILNQAGLQAMSK
ncbi:MULTISPECIES: FAD-dependent oxidoreductase [Bacillaceae]|uniref:NADPH-dependent 2,4-dienoyl-CoA reductase/sulfur reductase-like enzyme n=1 Tax=Peribacillus huizhouensis TaxID=1501239 RepID=A0ABR6CJ89_9BACI|nr:MULTISPECIES: FAD-dependent oxidoreductase [Bacillaceae]MBA9025144.1 NADPH-dependent 2,4-dienoyl-CoA reductase/sulfur reductase-like enzyme [Peribacillus huizhouensis]